MKRQPLDYFDKELCNRLKKSREAAKLSYKKLEELTGISRSTLQRYETGKSTNITNSKLEIIAKALNVTPAYLMGWEDENGVTSSNTTPVTDSSNNKNDIFFIPLEINKENYEKYNLEEIYNNIVKEALSQYDNNILIYYISEKKVMSLEELTNFTKSLTIDERIVILQSLIKEIKYNKLLNTISIAFK